MLKWFHKKAKKKIIDFALYCAHIVHTVQKYVNFNQTNEWASDVFSHLSQKVNRPWHQFWTILKRDRKEFRSSGAFFLSLSSRHRPILPTLIHTRAFTERYWQQNWGLTGSSNVRLILPPQLRKLQEQQQQPQLPAVATEAVYHKTFLWKRAPVPQPASIAILHTRYPAAAVATRTSAPPTSRGAITRTVTPPPPESQGAATRALGLCAPREMITGGSALSAPEGVFNGATAPNNTNWRKRDLLKHRLHLYQLEQEMGR